MSNCIEVWWREYWVVYLQLPTYAWPNEVGNLNEIADSHYESDETIQILLKSRRTDLYVIGEQNHDKNYSHRNSYADVLTLALCLAFN